MALQGDENLRLQTKIFPRLKLFVHRWVITVGEAFLSPLILQLPRTAAVQRPPQPPQPPAKVRGLPRQSLSNEQPSLGWRTKGPGPGSPAGAGTHERCATGAAPNALILSRWCEEAHFPSSIGGILAVDPLRWQVADSTRGINLLSHQVKVHC